MNTSPSLERLTQRLVILQASHGYRLLDENSFAAFIAAPGASLILFAEDPVKVPETWDLSVILPEIVAGLDTPVRVGVLACWRRRLPEYWRRATASASGRPCSPCATAPISARWKVSRTGVSTPDNCQNCWRRPPRAHRE
jgi:hypothetical protein